MNDSKMIQHETKRYYNGPGTTMYVRYSRFVPANVNVEVYADDCQIASIYRNTEGELIIPPGTDQVSFIRRDGVCFGKFKMIAGENDHVYIYFNYVPPTEYVIIASNEYPVVDTDAEEKSYSDFIKDMNIMEKYNLVAGLLCSIGPLVFKAFI